MKLHIVLSIVLTGVLTLNYAQHGRQIQDQVLLQEVGLQSDNLTMLRSASFEKFGETSLGYQITDGKFKHPLLSDQSHYMQFSSARYQDLKDWKLYGQFSLNLGRENGVSNTTQLDPLRLNPYIMVDSLQGDWNKQDYGLDVGIASPYFNDRVSIGLGLRYQAKTGARQRDPRTENTHNVIEVRPAVGVKLTEQSLVGVYGLYSHFVEDLSLTNINYNRVHNVYKLLGLGEYMGSAPILMSSGLSRRYDGDKFGGGLNYLYTSGRTKGLVEAFYHHHSERAVDGTTYPQNAGKHAVSAYGAKAALSTSSGTLSHNVQLAWSQKDVENTEYHQYQDAATREYITLFSDVFNTNLLTEADVRYNLAKTKGNDFLWKLGGGMQYEGLDNRYATNLSQQTVDRLTYRLDFARYFFHTVDAGFVVNMGLGYSDAFKSSFHYEEKIYATDFVAQEILYPTNAFLSTDYWQGSLAVQYLFKPASNSLTQLYVKLGGHYRQPTNENAYFAKSMSRFTGQLAIGVYSF